MVLYEDLRVYTIWRSEMAQYKEESILYKKSAEEWELLGGLAERLHHSDEAIEAYEACLDMKFSPKAMKGLLSLHEREGDVKSMLAAIIRLVAWQYRWYSEVSKLSTHHGLLSLHSLYLTFNDPSSLQPSCTPSANLSRRKAL